MFRFHCLVLLFYMYFQFWQFDNSKQIAETNFKCCSRPLHLQATLQSGLHETWPANMKRSAWQKMLGLRSRCSPTTLDNFLYIQSPRSFLPLPPKIQLKGKKTRSHTQFSLLPLKEVLLNSKSEFNLMSFRPQHKSISLTTQFFL